VLRQGNVGIKLGGQLMKIKSWQDCGRIVALLVVLAALAGCAGTIKPEAFGRGKSYAIVSIAATPEIGNMGERQQTITGLVKAASSESGYTQDATAILRETVPLFQRGFTASKSFRLQPEAKVVKQKAYSAMTADSAKAFMTTFKVAPGYKYFSDEKKCAALAKSLNVDGVICMMVNYGYVYNGVNIGGLVGGGVHKAVVHLTVVAYDKNGRVVWNDHVVGKSDDSIGTASEAVNFKELHPLLLNASGNAVKELLKNLAEKVG
jgi:hypothetical protein